MDLRDINFPFFGLYKRPYEIKYSLSKIQLKREENSHLETVDDKSLNGDYFARLAQLNKRLMFDCTCKDIQQLIYERPKWGMDARSQPFDLSEKIYCPAMKKPVVKIRDNLIWFKGISYPFKIPSNDELHKIKDIYGILVQYRLEWYIKQFTYDDKPLKIESINL
tara:strand:- start:662 stop:1156 length:495 start_codon:yes stop_codon:yes gene_type:complete